MSWNGQGNMGPSSGGGLGGLVSNDMSGGGPGNAGSQPHGTEYTLQGVMRFLQTEWHRHERDRNAWEIEKQEMKGRIASLEGSARRADATQKALKKYVTILEKKVKDQSALLKSSASGTDATDTRPESEKQQQASKILEKLRGIQDDKDSQHSQSIANPEYGGRSLAVGDEDDQRSDLRVFLDQCQAEFTYLMVTPANPMPPRESPPLPLMDDLPDDDFGLPAGQQQMEQFAPPPTRAAQQAQNLRQTQSAVNHVNQQQQQQHQQHQQLQQQQQVQAGNYPSTRGAELQPAPMTRSGADVNASAYAAATAASDWPPQAAQTTSSSHPLEDRDRVSQADSRAVALGEKTAEAGVTTEPDAWDFNDGPASFPEPSPLSAAQQQPVSNRPDTDIFPAADSIPKSPNRLPGSHRRKGSMSRRRSADHELSLNSTSQKTQKTENGNFKMRFGLRGHLDTVRTVIFSGGGSPGEPEICTAGDDGLIKRFHIPRTTYLASGNVSDLDVQADFTHRGHHGAVLCLASWFAAPNFSTGGRAQGDGWIFSGGQDNFIRVWERGRVDPKATIDGHTDAVWALCVLPATLGAVFGQSSTSYGSPDRILLASGAADGTVRVWSVSAPPQMTSPQPGSGAPNANRRGVGGTGGRVRGNSMSSGSGFPSSPQPTVASNSPFNYTLIHTIVRANSKASPTSITALSSSGGTFVVSYSDAAILVYDTRTGEEIGSMASLETYDGTAATSVNAVVATTVGLEQPQLGDEDLGGGGSHGGPTGGGRRSMAGSGVEGVIISGHEDQFIRFFDANSGQCTYNMLAHPAAISGLSLSPDGRELVSAGHDASLRFWSLEKRSCTQEITSHRIMRGEGVCSVVWSQDGRWVVSGGGDGVVKVFAR
ncbi:PRO11 protein [Sporothrix schenckii 1099-18]|uniref:PRO11 protein n=1 Tax=Sporothrix schenckii 1099-18 TaxID=1397361 RepID=A0A0F2MCL6_SPOSC|nr:PRO11 protein [Sporothrix schenckii 1099-18]KJR86824.1 PRO11 protein [Sporothrix schenckii 1099-18]